MHYKISDSPLTTKASMKSALKDSSFCERGIRYLQWAQMITMHRINGTSCSYSEYQHDHLEPDSRMQESTSPLFRIVQRTSDIYLGALRTPPIPFSSPINRKWAVALCSAVESPTNDEVWDRCPGIFTWVLLVGCAAAEEGSTEYNYFVCLLIKVALGAGYGWLDTLTEAVKRFIKIKELAKVEENLSRLGSSSEQV
ncbi:hypothetical protein L207DRAFT_292210 [Hyaloscypha variabilis F]|uniref:Uncharacterized protein n=1 Tax=Hyaloscypha variabilis (strain UAMH 11265 / GT02V1 / F) TaxID=1149755 RepID=A0A2J6RXL0_HYAVF|nr:hypothetical protein L207DRAFT_292210 [Hyaloscypha variabilis F]